MVQETVQEMERKILYIRAGAGNMVISLVFQCQMS